MPPLHPTLNALFNLTAAVLLVLGRRAIQRGNRDGHKRLMIAAFAASSVFLASYLIYHTTKEAPVRFEGPAPLRILYLSILIPHIILAVAMLPFIFAAFVKAFQGRFEAHRKLVRWVWPVWMYVSVTGVVIYAMLYLM